MHTEEERKDKECVSCFKKFVRLGYLRNHMKGIINRKIHWNATFALKVLCVLSPLRSIKKYTKTNHITPSFASTVQSGRVVLIFMLKLILMRDRLNVIIVLKDIVPSDALYCIQEFILVKSLSNAKCVPKSFPKVSTGSLTLSWFIQMERTYVVIFAKRHLKQRMLWKFTNLALMLKREFFLQRLPWKLQNKWDPSEPQSSDKRTPCECCTIL